MFRRTLIIASLVLAVATTSVFAQGLRRKAEPRGRQGPRLERIQKRLNLNEGQKNGIRALQENRRREMEALKEEMRQKRQALRSLVQEGNPNPTDVGNAKLALKETQADRKAINERFRAGAKEILTPEQQQKLRNQPR